VTEPGGLRPGPANSLADVAGLGVGHASRLGGGWLTGTTVIVTRGDGAVAGVDVRGGGPGTRETDLLDPRNAAERVHAVVLGGGSAFGLAAADGVMARLAQAGRGKPVGLPGCVVPIVPAASRRATKNRGRRIATGIRQASPSGPVQMEHGSSQVDHQADQQRRHPWPSLEGSLPNDRTTIRTHVLTVARTADIQDRPPRAERGTHWPPRTRVI
jgi:hypothetical protein